MSPGCVIGLSMQLVHLIVAGYGAGPPCAGRPLHGSLLCNDVAGNSLCAAGCMPCMCQGPQSRLNDAWVQMLKEADSRMKALQPKPPSTSSYSLFSLDIQRSAPALRLRLRSNSAALL